MVEYEASLSMEGVTPRMSPAGPSSLTTAASVAASPGRRSRATAPAAVLLTRSAKPAEPALPTASGAATRLAAAAGFVLAAVAAACEAACSSSNICRRIFARSIGLVMAAAMTQDRPP